MPNKTISQLPAVEAAEENAVIACDNAAGTTTQKVTIGQIVALAGSGNPFDQDLNTDDAVQFASASFIAPAPEGETVPGIVINSTEVAFPNGTKLTEGSFDNGTGGSNGVSLYCAVGYELNWQGGRLACTTDGGATATGFVIDSAIQCMEGITFGDSTEQTTAWTGTVAVGDVTGLSWQGDWGSPEGGYANRDVVVYNNALWVSTASEGGNTTEPGAEGASWTAISGPAGPTGAQGDAGPIGPAGITAWDNTTSYATGDLVTYSGGVYQATSAPIAGEDPVTYPSPWQAIATQGAAGPTGPAGLGFTSRGEWSATPSPAYAVGDVVSFEGRLYYCTTAETTLSPANASDWTLLIRGLRWRGDFVPNESYAINDLVRWDTDGNCYVCVVATSEFDPSNTTCWSLFVEKGPPGITAWNTMVTYATGDLVTESGNVYQATQGSSSSAPSMNPSYWQQIAVAGAPGLNWLGAWSSMTNYVADDAVSHNGASYICISGNVSTEPGVAAGWDQYWSVLAAKGDTGATGPAGDVTSITGTEGQVLTIVTGTWAAANLPVNRFRGVYDTMATYTADDHVTYSDALWKAATGASAYATPGTDSSWDKVAEKAAQALGTSDSPTFSALTLSSLPTSDPAVAGQIWNDSGTLKISAGGP